MKAKICAQIGLCMATVALAACNAGPLLKTGSLTAQPTVAPPPPPEATSVDRALHVAATSIRAQKCGFYFDAAALRSNFLAAEATRGTPPEALAKATASYDYTEKSVGLKIPKPDEYCTEARAGTIKASLQAALAGNFDPPIQKQVVAVQTDIFGNFLDGDGQPDTFNKDEIYDPIMNEPGKSSRPQ